MVSKCLSVQKRCPLLGGSLTKIVTFVTKHFVRYTLPSFFRITCVCCNHFEELQTMLFEVELIINNAPLTYR